MLIFLQLLLPVFAQESLISFSAVIWVLMAAKQTLKS